MIRVSRLVFPVLLILAFLGAGMALADCSENEMTAVFVVEGIEPGWFPSITTLEMSPVIDITNPSDEEMYQAILAVTDCWPGGLQECRGHYCFYSGTGMMNHAAFVDNRTCDVIFSGSIIWMGEGSVEVPLSSSHEWSYPGGPPAPEPQEIDVFSHPDGWVEDETPEELTARVLERLRNTDVLKSFGECGPYSAMTFIYYPTVGGIDYSVAKLIVIVSGHCGEPWNVETVAVEQSSWSGVKRLFK